jgi:opacity protein-like surface antigen
MTPAWILDVFAAVMLVVAALSAARIVAARPWRPGAAVLDTDVAHLLMAVAMAGMLAGSLRTLPDGAWEVVFGVLTAWFGYRVVRDARASGVRALAGGHCAPHLVHSAAMLYMFTALATPAAGGGMGGMGGSAMQTLDYPTLAFVFGVVLAGYTVWDLDLLSGGRYRVAVVAGPALAGVPVLAVAEPGTGPLSAASAVGGGRTADAPSRSAEPAPAHPGRNAARAVLLSAGVTVGCRIAMGVTMAFMLFVMI